MGEFFKGWRRKAGLVTLVVACLLILTTVAQVNVQAQDDPQAAKRMITDQNFTDLTFSGEAALKMTRENFDSRLANEIRVIHRFCSLTDEQRAKLQLAGKGDFNQWLKRVKEARMRYVGKPLTFHERRYADIEMSFIRLWPNDLALDRDCLLQKTLKKLVKEEQEHGYAHYRREQRVAQLELVWKRWEKQMNLSRETRDKLNEILLESAPPLPRNGEYRDLIILLQMQELKDRVKPVMRESELEQFKGILNLALANEGYIRHFDLWPVKTSDDEVPAAK